MLYYVFRVFRKHRKAFPFRQPILYPLSSKCYVGELPTARTLPMQLDSPRGAGLDNHRTSPYQTQALRRCNTPCPTHRTAGANRTSLSQPGNSVRLPHNRRSVLVTRWLLSADFISGLWRPRSASDTGGFSSQTVKGPVFLHISKTGSPVVLTSDKCLVVQGRSRDV